MSHRRRWMAGGFVLVLGIAGLAASQPLEIRQATDLQPLAAWVPAKDVVVYLAIPDTRALARQVESERVWNAVKEIPAIRDVENRKEYRDLSAVAQVIAASLDTTPRQGIEKLLGGRAELVVYGQDQVILRIEPADRDFLNRLHAKVVELMRQDAASKGYPNPVKETEVGGLTVFEMSPNEAHAIIDGTLVVSTRRELLTQVIERRAAGSADGSLESNSLYAERLAAASGATGWGYVDLDRLREIDPNAFKPNPGDAGATLVFGPWIDVVQQAGWAGIRLDWTDSRLAAALDVPRPEAPYREELQGFVPPDATSGAPLPLEVPGLIASASLYRDLEAIWEARAELFPPEAQQGFAQLDSTAGTFFGGRDFGTGVLGSMGKNWRVVVARQDPNTLSPRPDVVLPAVALIAEVDPDDTELAQRLLAGFQSMVGLVNLGTAQQKGPPLILGSEAYEGLMIATSRYLPVSDETNSETPVDPRFNVTPSAVQVGPYFVISSTLPLAKDLVKVLQSPSDAVTTPTPATLVIQAQGAPIVELIDLNRERLITDNMLKEGNDRAQAEVAIGVLQSLVKYLGHGRFTATDGPQALELRVDFTLGQP